MARPPTIKDEVILRAAREVFLEHGIRATTAQVARRAAVAEGSIFNRFKTKAELFQAAMRPNLDEVEFLTRLPGRVGVGDLRESLVAVALEIIDFLRAILPLTLMAWSNPEPSGLPAILGGPNPLPQRVVQGVTEYLEAEIRARHLKKTDAEIAARMFLGSLVNFVLFEVLLRIQPARPPGENVRTMVEILLTGIED